MERLRSLIGQHVSHLGIACQIIEVLEDGPSLVLQESTPHSIIQADQHGEAHRRVVPSHTVPVRDAVSGQINPAFAKLLGENSQ